MAIAIYTKYSNSTDSNSRINTLLDAIICDLKNYLDSNSHDEYFDSVLDAAELVKALINN